MTKDYSINSKIDWNALPREEAVELAMRLFGFTKLDAEFYISVAKGEIEPDPKKQKGKDSVYYD